MGAFFRERINPFAPTEEHQFHTAVSGPEELAWRQFFQRHDRDKFLRQLLRRVIDTNFLLVNEMTSKPCTAQRKCEAGQAIGDTASTVSTSTFQPRSKVECG